MEKVPVTIPNNVSLILPFMFVKSSSQKKNQQYHIIYDDRPHLITVTESHIPIFIIKGLFEYFCI